MIQFLKNLFGGVAGLAANVRDAIVDGFRWVREEIVGWFGDAWEAVGDIWRALVGVVRNLDDFARAAWDVINRILGPILGQIRERIADVYDAAFNFVRATRDHIFELLDKARREVVGWFAGMSSWVLDTVWRPLMDRFNYVKDLVGDAVDFVRRFGSALAEFASKWLGRILRWLNDPMGETIRWLDSFAKSAPRVVLQWGMQAVAREADELDDFLARWFRL